MNLPLKKPTSEPAAQTGHSTGTGVWIDSRGKRKSECFVAVTRERIPGLDSDGYMWIRSSSESMTTKQFRIFINEWTKPKLLHNTSYKREFYKIQLDLYWPSKWFKFYTAIGIFGPKKPVKTPNSGCCPCASVQWCKNPREQQCSWGHSCQALSFGFSSAVQTLIASKMRYCARNIHLSKMIRRKYLICFIPTVTPTGPTDVSCGITMTPGTKGFTLKYPTPKITVPD